MPSMGILPLDGAPQGHPGCALEDWRVQVCGWPPATSALGFGEPDSLRGFGGGKGTEIVQGRKIGDSKGGGRDSETQRQGTRRPS